MNVHLLCPGPSLARYAIPDPRPGLVLGVNRAVLAHACDVWVACDAPLIERINKQVIGTPHLVCGTNSRGAIWDHGVRWPEPITVQNDLFCYCPHEMNWCMFSSLTALVYAGYRGAKRIDVYGADMVGVEDYDGVKAGQNRSEDRWRNERELWANRVVPWLNDHGVEVVRHEL